MPQGMTCQPIQLMLRNLGDVPRLRVRRKKPLCLAIDARRFIRPMDEQVFQWARQRQIECSILCRL